jgi:hypothetical protein
MNGVETVFTPFDPPPDYDLYFPLLSMPRLVGTTLQNIPADVPYVHPDKEMSSRWHERLAEHHGRKKVGLVWAGRPQHTNDRNRSMKLNLFEPLLQVDGVTFFSLQTGKSQTDQWLIDLSGQLDDFAMTAAVIANLDLVITVDTAVAHLAGALGKPAWVLLPFVPDWRWLLDRDDSPWYPTMRLFRQVCGEDWEAPIRQVISALKELVRT